MSWGGRKIARLRAVVILTYGSTCIICNKPIDLHRVFPDPRSFTIEHVHPRGRGGSDELRNLRPAHLGCNSARGDRPTAPLRRPHRVGSFLPDGPPREALPLPVSPRDSRKNGIDKETKQQVDKSDTKGSRP